MNLLFLSTDGVLTNQRQIDRAVNRGIHYAYEYQNQIDPKKVGLLNILVRKGNFDVIFTGTWKNRHSTGLLNSMLKKVGATFSAIDSVPILYKSNGGKFATTEDEIENYMINLYNKGINVGNLKYAILDDRSVYTKYAHNFIKVKYDQGLTHLNVEKCLKMVGVKDFNI